MCLFEFKELVIFVGFGVFFHAFCGWAFLFLSYFKFTQIIGNDNEHWWQSITSPRWVPNRWQKETFYNWLSFASHSFCFEKELRGDKKHAENIQLWLWAAILDSIWTGTDLLHNANNSRLKPLFTLVHVRVNTTRTTGAYR